MKRVAWMLGLGSLLAALAGCGGSEAAQEEKSSQAMAALETFLNAVREGDDKTAEGMLTPLARKKTKEADLVVTPPGRDTATFELGKVEWLDEETAQVDAKWSDVGHDGQTHTDEIVWRLKQVEGDWRIAGMGAKPFEDLPRFYLNFEDPEDMQRQLETIEQEMVRRSVQQAQPQNQQAQQPSQPGDTSTVR